MGPKQVEGRQRREKGTHMVINDWNIATLRALIREGLGGSKCWSAILFYLHRRQCFEWLLYREGGIHQHRFYLKLFHYQIITNKTVADLLMQFNYQTTYIFIKSLISLFSQSTDIYFTAIFKCLYLSWIEPNWTDGGSKRFSDFLTSIQQLFFGPPFCSILSLFNHLCRICLFCKFLTPFLKPSIQAVSKSVRWDMISINKNVLSVCFQKYNARFKPKFQSLFPFPVQCTTSTSVLLCQYYLRFDIYWAFGHGTRHWFQSLGAHKQLIRATKTSLKISMTNPKVAKLILLI